MKTRRQSATKVQRRKAPTAVRHREASAAYLQEQLDQRTRERDEARKHLAEALEQQTATSEVLRVISSSPGDLEPVFQAMLASATQTCEAKFGLLYRIEGDSARIISRLGIPPALAEYLKRGPHRPPLNRLNPLTPIGRVAQSRQLVHIPDLRTDQSYLNRDPLIVAGIELGGIRTLLVVPMIKNDALMGAIVIFRQEVRPFTDKQIELVQNFAESGRHRHREHTPAQRAARICCSSRPPPPTCSRSSAARPSISKPCSTRWSNRPPDYARRTWRPSRVSTARTCVTSQATATRPTSRIHGATSDRAGARHGDRPRGA